MTKSKTIQCGTLLSSSEALFSSTSDDPRTKGKDLSYVFRLWVDNHVDATTPKPNWVWNDYDWHVTSVCESGDFLRCVLSREGQVNLYGPGGKPDHTFQIPEAGVFGEGAVGLGYVNRIRAVGSLLLVCGQSRQVYRFEWDGKHLAQGRWVDMAGPMRQPPMPEPPDDADDSAFDAWLDSNDAIDFVDINGPSHDDLYAVGDEAWHWDGRAWERLDLPGDEPLAAIKVLSAKEVVIVGHNGTVLWGNARDGFKDLSGVDDNQNFTGVEWFEGRLFLASNLGMYTYDPATRKIEAYASSLKPDLKDTHQLEAKDSVLWSFGFKDLAYFDGQAWTRVDHPDNPPIR